MARLLVRLTSHRELPGSGHSRAASELWATCLEARLRWEQHPGMSIRVGVCGLVPPLRLDSRVSATTISIKASMVQQREIGV